MRRRRRHLATGGSRSRAGPTTSSPGSHAITGADVEAWTRTRRRIEVAEQLQAAGIEAVPVSDFGDLNDDPQLAHRGHFEPHTHPFMGPGLYERNGFRLAACPGGYDAAGPTLGQDNDWALGELLGLSEFRDRGIAGNGRGGVS